MTKSTYHRRSRRALRDYLKCSSLHPYHVHHLDGRYDHVCLTNLDLLTPGEHNNLHKAFGTLDLQRMSQERRFSACDEARNAVK